MPPRGMCLPSTCISTFKTCFGIPGAYCTDDLVPTFRSCTGISPYLFSMGRPQELSVLQGKLFGRAGTELRHRSWAVHRLNTCDLLKSGMWSRVRDWDPEWSFPISLCPCVEFKELKKKNKPDVTYFYVDNCQDTSREHILYSSLLVRCINFEYFDSKCLGTFLSSSLSLYM